jgi:diamine N-acetyltransferase
MDDIKLIDITTDNWEKICRLYPGKDGREFVASNAFSIAQSVFEKGWVIKGIAKDDLLIGFTMYGFSEELNACELCRFMIDEHYQGNGYGKRALQIIVDEMFRNYGCDKIYLSTAPSNSRGKHIYRNAGFVPTGETCGEGDGIEDIFCLIRN